MRVLVTGGAGFIGSHLVETLLARDQRVTVLDNLSTGRAANLEGVRAHPNLRFLRGDVRQADELAEALRGVELIFHLAAHVGVRRIMEQTLESLRNNVDATLAVLAAAAQRGPRTLLFSSSEVYGKGHGGPLAEEDDLAIGTPAVTRWSYATGKALDEALALAYHREQGLPVTVVRCFNTCGPRQTGRYGMVLPTFIHQALAGEPLTVYGDGEQTRCFSYVGDVVRGALLLAAEPTSAGEIFNVGNDEEVTIGTLAERIVAGTASRSRIVRVPYARAFGEHFEDVRRRVPSLAKIRDCVGYRPEVDLEKLLQLTIASFQQPAGASAAPQAPVLPSGVGRGA